MDKLLNHKTYRNGYIGMGAIALIYIAGHYANVPVSILDKITTWVGSITLGLIGKQMAQDTIREYKNGKPK